MRSVYLIVYFKHDREPCGGVGGDEWHRVRDREAQWGEFIWESTLLAWYTIVLTGQPCVAQDNDISGMLVYDDITQTVSSPAHRTAASSPVLT
jgi:hypothetical protein